jgi:hypothetical protein
MDTIKDIEVLSHLRDGDVVLVRVHNDTPPEEIDAMHTALQAAIQTEVTIIVTNEELVGSMKVLSLAALVEMKEKLDLAIQLRMSSPAAEG